MVTKTKPSHGTAWGLAEAKNNLSRVFTRAIDEGPQEITRREHTAVLISKTEYERLRKLEPEKPNFKEFLLSWAREPNPDDPLDIPHSQITLRAVEQ